MWILSPSISPVKTNTNDTHTKLWPDFFFYMKVLHNASKSDTLTLSDSLKTAIELKNKIIKNKDDFTFLNDASFLG